VVAAFGYWIVLLMGGRDMLAAYPLTIILSTTILFWLVVTAHINFIFVPQRRYYFVTGNQIVAFSSFTIFCGVGLFLFKNIMVLAVALSLSSVCELLYCRYLTKKYKML
jgi:PST family polysaccharide transporter